jgi:Zn-dependent M28 family amino/carboxypeptidase
MQLKNVLGRIEGADESLAPVVVGAHYDHLGLGWPDVREGNEGQIHNGADDNASGVAVLLELARVLGGDFTPRRDVILAAFTGEESGLRGSRRFVDSLGKKPSEAVFAMVNLDSVGRLEGRKLKVLGTGSAKEWVHIVMGVGYTAGIQAESIGKDSGGGDQVSFLIKGIPAVHVFAGPHPDYHSPTDDADKIDADGMMQAAVLVKEMAAYLADRAEPLTLTLEEALAPRPDGDGERGGRRASLGTMPDFAYQDGGVRVAAVMPGSAAEGAGMREGDIITAIDDREVKDLPSFSELLKELAPGETVTVHFLRDGKPSSVEAVLKAR